MQVNSIKVSTITYFDNGRNVVPVIIKKTKKIYLNMECNQISSHTS